MNWRRSYLSDVAFYPTCPSTHPRPLSLLHDPLPVLLPPLLFSRQPLPTEEPYSVLLREVSSNLLLPGTGKRQNKVREKLDETGEGKAAK